MDVKARLAEIWEFTLISTTDGDLTVGKFVIAIIFAFFGYFFSRRASRICSRPLEKRFDMPVSKVAVVQTLAFYLIYLFVIAIILSFLDVPVTIFAVLGSAVAIGVGFGSQTIVKNFLAGLTVLVEQPIKIGDLVEVEGTYGLVESIGFRSTRIRTADNIHMIIPNSTFLENKVMNFTLSDSVVRGRVNVGVAYGSDLDLVKEILLNLHEELEFILKDPPSTCHFTDFGSSSLDFTYFFFVQVSSRAQIRGYESKVRFKVDEKFRQAGITIAFPQLDVHVQSLPRQPS